MKKNKKRQASFLSPKLMLVIGSLLAVIVVVAGGIGVTLALMKGSDQRTNDFSVGNFRAELVEEFTPPIKTELDTPYTKDVSVRNTGEGAGFIRVLLLPQILAKADSQGNQLLLPSTIGEELKINLDLVNWADGQDGYYYYLNGLEPGEKTPSLFTTVTIDSQLAGENYQGAELTIDVKVEGINNTKWAYQDAWWNDDPVRWSTGNLEVVNDVLKTKVVD